MTRRTFFRSLGASLSPVCPTLSFAAGLAADKPGVPVIDTHIHLFDVSRPQGVPWPPRDSGIYRSALPPRYRQLAVPHGIVGAIAIECSPWLADNQWLLDVAGQDPLLVGVIGNLEPGTPGFAKHLERFQANPLFRGIRYGNLWGRDLSKEVLKPAFIEDLKTLAAAGLALDTANPNPALLHAVVQLTDLVPKLTVILDHLPALQAPDDLAARRTCELDLRQLSARPQVTAKLSGIVRTVKGRVPLAVDYYRDRLDHIWETFGPDRLLYGSDWPNSEQWASYSAVFQLAERFVAAKDSASIEKFYWRNALRVYRWKKREGSVAPQ